MNNQVKNVTITNKRGRSDFSLREVRGRSWWQQREVGGLLGEVNGDNSRQYFATCLKLPCPNLVISKKLSDLICSVFFNS
jgi:hypothetical protein